ncbi:hypothetical protein B0H13DRAFT_400233 [Mycena leptocephala]|nr:hypothetical protein B0H13DRAFT_400233 [Mycena leptocephala]
MSPLHTIHKVQGPEQTYGQQLCHWVPEICCPVFKIPKDTVVGHHAAEVKGQGEGEVRLQHIQRCISPNSHRAAAEEDHLPKVSYDTLKDKQLRDKLVEHGLPTTGERTAWIARHQRCSKTFFALSGIFPELFLGGRCCGTPTSTDQPPNVRARLSSRRIEKMGRGA